MDRQRLRGWKSFVGGLAVLLGPAALGAEPDPWAAPSTACVGSDCRWKAAREQQEAVKQQRVQAREALMKTLIPSTREGESDLVWLQRVDQVLAGVEAAAKLPGDRELAARALDASNWAREERGKLALVGAERALVLQLLHLPAAPSARIITLESDTVQLHCAMEGERCVGVYLVGRDKAGRVLNAPAQAEETAALLSQALGQSVPLPTPPAREGTRGPTTSTWKVGTVPVVARWRNSDLMELRVGDLKP
ncbi:hypothetical protein STIAU_6231 [Stigmatella aurantiaca DW4/3-1]|nr:hypothetical protein STIAU_6231 [Stigmatella aurantiaca DW4/3-1]